MAGRLRSPATALALSVLVLVATTRQAAAAESWTCWSGVVDGEQGQATSVTRCRLAGSETTADYGSRSQVPVVLRPQVGTDGDGVCWFWTSAPSQWVVLDVDGHGVATLGIDPDGTPGGPLIIDAAYPACGSEPAQASTTLLEAWELLSRYEHPVPNPVFDPPAGGGVAGMEVFVTDRPPDPWAASLVSPDTGVRIEVETRVVAVEVDWGDGRVDMVPPAGFDLLTGWPDGGFGHVYETKTCPVPDGSRCHPRLAEYPLTVAYVWAARYRVDRSEWIDLPVPPTARTVGYDVDEIRSIRTAAG